MKRNQLRFEGNDVIGEIHNCLDMQDEEQLTIIIDSWLETPTVNKLPRSIILELFKFASGAGNLELWKKLIAHAKHFSPEFYQESSAFIAIFNLELDWRTGKNIDQIIEKFELLYTKCISDEVLTKQIDLLEEFCSVMIRDSVEKKGESVVVKLKEKLEQMCEKSKDYHLLFDLWKNLFER